ncbi:hypothetical protein [Roseomonas haemaphysalidis]|uniref:Uncharacterized protein n=1 Tax=Roseomonas haemaphysalidis TaxID=2768162 RepID=A0ABS3KWM4_9PROT|nr:hypothetical protein [Roseomonas haemaphysalidis]MBO1081839.1 hypothetical protein [Roseomonas haemaphysalidis]
MSKVRRTTRRRIAAGADDHLNLADLALVRLDNGLGVLDALLNDVRAPNSPWFRQLSYVIDTIERQRDEAAEALSQAIEDLAGERAGGRTA